MDDALLVAYIAGAVFLAVGLWILTLPLTAAAPRCILFLVSRVLRRLRCKGLRPFTSTSICEDHGTLLLGSMPRTESDIQELLGRKRKLAIVSLNALWELTIAGLQESLLKERGVNFIRVPTPDFFAPSQQDIDASIAFIEVKLAVGALVLVHCNAGRGRSAVVVICFLMKHLSLSAADAFDYVWDRRKIARMRICCGTRPQWRACLRYERRLQRQVAAKSAWDAGPSPDSVGAELPQKFQVMA